MAVISRNGAKELNAVQPAPRGIARAVCKALCDIIKHQRKTCVGAHDHIFRLYLHQIRKEFFAGGSAVHHTVISEINSVFRIIRNRIQFI